MNGIIFCFFSNSGALNDFSTKDRPLSKTKVSPVMFKQFFSDHKDAVVYSKVCVTLLRDFDVDVRSLEKIVGQNLIIVIKMFRQTGFNAESFAVRILAQFLVYIKADSLLRFKIPVNEQAWIDQAMKYGQSGLVPSSELQLFLLNLADASTVSEGGGTSRAVKWFEEASLRGNAAAQACLGLCYEYGQGLDRNLTEAVKFYRKAAEQGDSTAQHRLGCCLARGTGVDLDSYEAVRWLRKSAEAGNESAQNALGWCYEEGKGVSKDQFEAFKWYQRAAEKMDPSARTNLGRCYEFGKGVAKDLTQALK